MSDESTWVEQADGSDKAGRTRQGTAIELIVCVDSPDAAHEDAARLPNYAVDMFGTVRQHVADERAGGILGRAVYERRLKNIDRLALSVSLERAEGQELSDMQVAALHSLLAELYQRHGLDEAALATILPDEEGRPRVYAYLPPAPALEESGAVLGAAADPAVELRLFLFGETWKQRAGASKQDTAFAFYAMKHNLGAPMAPNAAPAASHGGKSYNFQVFARDTVYNEGSDWTGVQTFDGALGDDKAPRNLALALVSASFDASVKATEARSGLITNTKNYRPDWAFHIIAANSALGPAVSGNYAPVFDQKYYFQVFAGDTLYTPESEPAGCYFLSRTDPSHPAYHKLWEETYKYAKAPYDPNSPFQQRAVADKLGTPLSGVYQASHNGATYTIQVFALDTLYAGPDGAMRRMSELPLPPAVAAWKPTAPKVAPPAPAAPPPAAKAPAQLGKFSAPAGDPNWPPLPNYWILSDRGGQREKLLGNIQWRPKGNSREVEILNDWKAQNIVIVEVPQLAKFKFGNGGKVPFHKVAAEQFRRLWQEVENHGLLDLVLTYDGGFYPRVMKSDARKLSNHSYGTAFDINVQWNGWLAKPALVGQKGSVREIAHIANQLGFFWGGHWNPPLDGMHFEWAVAR
jgi:hypothetical protein